MLLPTNDRPNLIHHSLPKASKTIPWAWWRPLSAPLNHLEARSGTINWHEIIMPKFKPLTWYTYIWIRSIHPTLSPLIHQRARRHSCADISTLGVRRIMPHSSAAVTMKETSALRMPWSNTFATRSTADAFNLFQREFLWQRLWCLLYNL